MLPSIGELMEQAQQRELATIPRAPGRRDAADSRELDLAKKPDAEIFIERVIKEFPPDKVPLQLRKEVERAIQTLKRGG